MTERLYPMDAKALGLPEGTFVCTNGDDCYVAYLRGRASFWWGISESEWIRSKRRHVILHLDPSEAA